MKPDHPYAGTIAAVETLRAQYTAELAHVTEPGRAWVLRRRLAKIDGILRQLAFRACQEAYLDTTATRPEIGTQPAPAGHQITATEN